MNLAWAFTYNILMMPATAGVFYPLGFYISPVWSSIAMSLSSIIVVAFAQLLMCFTYDDSLSNNEPSQSISIHDILLETPKQSNKQIFEKIP